MSFNYSYVNPEILEDLAVIFQKPSTQWTEVEYKKVIMILAGIQVVVNCCPHRFKTKTEPSPSASFGHGHVRPRADGVKARCGGPTLCRECAIEKAEFEKGKA